MTPSRKWIVGGLPTVAVGCGVIGLLFAGDAPAGAQGPTTIGKIERFDPAFDKLVPRGAKIEVLGEGYRWSEGPIWVGDGGYLLFSDIPNNVIHRFQNGGIERFLHPSGYTSSKPFTGGEPGSNGLTLDPKGRLVMCCHGDRCIARIEKDGSRTVLVDRYQGKRLNSPNDLVYRSNGDLYFTDPPYGQPKPPERELDFCGVYRLTGDGQLTLLTKEMTLPNGLAFSPDEKTLYVSQSDPKAKLWNALPVKQDGTLGKARVFCDATKWNASLAGLPDGLKVDVHGNLWATGPGGVSVFTSGGKLIGRIDTTRLTANCAFGEDGSTLFITAQRYLCRLRTTTRGMGF